MESLSFGSGVDRLEMHEHEPQAKPPIIDCQGRGRDPYFHVVIATPGPRLPSSFTSRA